MIFDKAHMPFYVVQINRMTISIIFSIFTFSGRLFLWIFAYGQLPLGIETPCLCIGI